MHATSDCTWTVLNHTVSPDMLFTKVGPATASPGETIAYTLTYENIGTGTAFGVTITEYYPADTAFVSAIPFPNIGNNVWILPSVSPGVAGTITVTVQISPSAAGSVTNTAVLEYELGTVVAEWTTIIV